MSEPKTTHPFVEYLQTLVEDRGALAALRRGLGRPAGHAPEMYPYIIPRLHGRMSRLEEEAHFLVASLFAFHAASTTQGNLGDHLAATIRNEKARQAIERRFVALLNAHPEDLGQLLRHTISFLKSQEQPVNWSQLLLDLCAWNHPDRLVQRRWARAFWSRPIAGEEEPESSDEGPS